MKTVIEILRKQSEHNPEAVAIMAPGRAPLSYRALCLQVVETVKSLHALGIGRNDRVALVLPNGPEMATAFLGVASAATCAPLNPSYRASEFDFYLSDLNAKAIILPSDLDSPARETAKARGLPIIEASYNSEDAAGIFRLNGGGQTSISAPVFATPDDVAMVLHTSGTTSRPKIVPLTHRNICTSAANICTTLQLSGRDRCLNVMPLFHIHGLMAAVLSSLTAGASIVCTPGFNAGHFFEWLSVHSPTWYTAVPTMHQSILARVEANPALVKKGCLRFIRSSSASLPPQVMKGLEEAFHAPVIESYGMTEASHQMASNPLPPAERKPGTVGMAAGPQVAIMDEAGNILPTGQTGEIIIRGDNVTLGYENNPAANESGFTNGWFRTGDQGVMDDQGYLSITGRLKEIINRGGEKIAPREVDEALLDHPGVAQAVAFAAPHKTLGEDLVAAVVLRNNSKVTEQELRQFAFSRLADHKVPSQIVIVAEIPKGPTGKLQRIGLAEKLAAKLQADYTAPRNALEETLAGIWGKILGVEHLGIHDNFFALGGDSLRAASVLLEMNKYFSRELHPSILFHSPTIEQLSGHLRAAAADSSSHLMPIQPRGTRPPLFLVPGHKGDVFTFVQLTRHLPPDQPVHVFRFPEAARQDDKVADAMLKEMAALYVGELRALQPEGPYHLGGFCFGAQVVYEMAQQLRAKGQKTALLAIINAYLPDAIRPSVLHHQTVDRLHRFMRSSLKEKSIRLKGFLARRIEWMSRRVAPSLTRRFITPPPDVAYFPLYYPGRVTLLRPLEGESGMYHDPYMGWKGLAAEMEVYGIAGNRSTIFREPEVQGLAERLKCCLDESAR